MFFVLSKIIAFFLNPLNLLVFIGLSLSFLVLFKWKKTSFFVAIGFLAFSILIGLTPISYNLLKNLEDNSFIGQQKLQGYINGETIIFENKNDRLTKTLDGVLVLGGGINGGSIPKTRNEISLNESAERMTKSIELFNKNKSIKILFSGYSGMISPHGLKEFEAANNFYLNMGVPKQNILLEKKSKNTYQNILYSKYFIKENEVWGVITSASHMKRVKSVIKKFQIKNTLIFFPVDFQTSKKTRLFSLNFSKGIKFWHIFLHENIGLIVYKLTGRA